jgi:hypothetical protein
MFLFMIIGLIKRKVSGTNSFADTWERVPEFNNFYKGFFGGWGTHCFSKSHFSSPFALGKNNPNCMSVCIAHLL